MSGVPGTVNVPCVVVREPGRVPLHLLIIEPLELGRDCAGLLITDPGVSRRHLLLRPDGDGVMVADLGSTNGTTMDGAAIAGTPCRLGLDQVVRLGATTIELLDRVSSSRTTWSTPRRQGVPARAAPSMVVPFVLPRAPAVTAAPPHLIVFRIRGCGFMLAPPRSRTPDTPHSSRSPRGRSRMSCIDLGRAALEVCARM